jgi:glutamate-1-semialdehyde aminotransferase
MTKSEQFLNKVLNRIPWGTQTNAKRPNMDYAGAMPFYIERAKGCRMWDIDGKEYIDYRLALGPIILGYCYPEVDEAVKKQMEKGSLFSMASPIEFELAEKIAEFVKCAEMVRFMKTGEDANSSVLRIARAYSGKDMLLSVGYHGYPDWFMTHQPTFGIPKFMADYVKEIPYGDIESAEKTIKEYAHKAACVIVNAYEFVDQPAYDFIKSLRKLTEENELILIFDEVLTGFRLAPGGAEEFFGVVPDMASYAKAMANGYPISAYVGKKKYMSKLNDIIITTTYAGETLSIAAAIATLNIMQRDKIHKHIHSMGERLMNGLNHICKELSIEGHAAGIPEGHHLKFTYKDPEFNTKLDFLFNRELYRNGIFTNWRWMLSYSHKEKDIDETLEKSRKALKDTLDAMIK